MIHGFQRVGSEVPFGEALVSYDDVSPIRDAAALEFLGAATTQTAEVDFDRYSRGGALFFRTLVEMDDESPAKTVSSKLTHESITDGWRLRVGVATDTDPYNKKQIFYAIETMGQDVVEAKKETYLLRGSMEPQVVDDGLCEVIVRDRKMYERPMVAKDCDSILAVLRQAAKAAEFRIPDPLASYRFRPENDL